MDTDWMLQEGNILPGVLERNQPTACCPTLASRPIAKTPRLLSVPRAPGNQCLRTKVHTSYEDLLLLANSIRWEVLAIHLEIANSGDEGSITPECRVHDSEPMLGFQLETVLQCGS